MERFSFPLEVSIRHYTYGTAYSTFSEDKYGSLEPGKSADFAIISIDPFRDGVSTLREAQSAVDETWINGEKLWQKNKA